MNRDLKTLKEAENYLIEISNAIETFRKRLSKTDGGNLYKAQEYLVASIQHIQAGFLHVQSSLKKAEDSKIEQEELEAAELAKATQGESNG